MRMDITHISAFGIELKQLEENDIPLLCHWRNHEEVLPYMEDNRPATSQTMRFWFNKVRCCGTTIPYFAYIDNNPIGYTEIKNIDRKNSRCEGGLFLFGPKYIGTGISYNIILCREIVMDRLNLKTLISSIHVNNSRSINFCAKYGGEYTRTEGEFLIYTYEFSRRRARLKVIADILGMSQEFSHYFEGEHA